MLLKSALMPMALVPLETLLAKEIKIHLRECMGDLLNKYVIQEELDSTISISLLGFGNIENTERTWRDASEDAWPLHECLQSLSMAGEGPLPSPSLSSKFPNEPSYMANLENPHLSYSVEDPIIYQWP
ncbi:hypothetical protein METBIDRAFT_147864 [Metschnikowia bicuspidata var. bicuspidata NRRL YB-4993]|uniref:Uncharacterized protein n=1 Tax=Metschnikowia bicuspidata var. bicuspidata NRRL YB-4993 TaxID=869754 RepID=A0A1A0HE34_9ASCO|nr:hypothetical protein METBIDRAFT_147864 [Metschnikowia bicuspidata var. bicuspidata NRRL YB-4993]OBA22162.1 hypothetical protein METBIDRAFT_147864 [Metschnikowia bicuspidata var. bicuspidata NRRL YB-4993]